ncbi:hypothetical protein N7462_002012 [Penicillium macrosclerotiorum]|uniref:uncharacterized protein n=1 Tax=Penicillium macrosclerotiorum TaxID=303699 RepID=UPI002546E0A5|nr:uncharacterized protein N7462_002012 [Penicillium macrosclerotiorum]KAJ5692589.1 hypothetical protein N7462_002012 [Penicillium macrosclerotiorum]
MEMNRPPLGLGEGLDRRHSDSSVPTHSQAMGPDVEFSHPHFAMIFINRNGELQMTASKSIAGCGGAIFTPDVTDRFMELAAPNSSAAMQFNPNLSQSVPSPWPAQSNAGLVHAGQTRPADLIPCEWQSSQRQRKRRDMKRTGMVRPQPKSVSPPPTPPPGKTILRVGNRDLLRRYYEKAFEDFQQLNCRAIAKSYIKLVEPRKQVHFPYNGRKVISGVSQRVDPEETKPGWWPAGVLHREPDHLLKRDRLKLLVHILCELKDSHEVTAEKLRDAGQDVRRQITPENRLQVLDEIYFVRHMEEQYLDGKIDANTLVQVTKTHLPEAIYQEDDFSSHAHAAPIASLDTENDGDCFVEKSKASLRDGDQAAYPVRQVVPLSPATSESSGPHSPTFSAYPVNMGSAAMQQESPTMQKPMPTDPNFMHGFYGQQFLPTEKAPPSYWPSVPPMPQVSQFGY